MIVNMGKKNKAKKKSKNDSSGIKTVCQNRKARFLYKLDDRFEAGMVLTGSEVKSLRLGQVNLTDAYADIRDEEAFLMQLQHFACLSPFHFAVYFSVHFTGFYSLSFIRGFFTCPQGQFNLGPAIFKINLKGDKRHPLCLCLTNEFGNSCFILFERCSTR